MNLIERVKNMIVTPKTEWEVIDQESATPVSVFKDYLLPLAIAGAIAGFIGYGFIGQTVLGTKIGGTLSFGLNHALISLLAMALGFFITTYVVDMLAPTFKSEKDLNKSAQLVAYSNTPALVGALLTVLPSIAWLGSLFGLYGLYLLYIGLPVMKKTPPEQRIAYIVVSILVLLVVYILLGAVLGAIISPMLGVSKVSPFGI
jgi:hypothetical protein